MDHGQKINRIKMPLISKRPTLQFVTIADVSLVKAKPIVEDHRLINWKKWLKRHQKQYHQALNEGGSQSKIEMVMHSCEDIRAKIEMRNLMEYAMISASTVPNKYRGKPNFWKVPSFLSTRGNFCSSKVGPVLTKTELNLLPTLEYVDFPVCIKEEKNLPNPLQKVSHWKHSSYPKKKEQELADTRAILQPSIPKLASLIAHRQGFGPKEKYVIHIPVITVMDMTLDNENLEVKSRASPRSTDRVVSLKINDFEITRGEQFICELPDSDSEKITWTLNFLSKIKQKLGKYLYFENTGTITITYQWRKTSSTSEILPLPSRNHTGFFFNKNKALILPGQKVKFPIWFQKHQVGMFSESWCMQTDPIMSRAAFIIRMCGHATIEYPSQLKVDEYLDRCIRNTAVRELIDKIIHDGRPLRPPEPAYKNLYLKRELFRVKNPSHFYHASLVDRLDRLYAAASAPDISSWSLSLIDLRHVLLQIKNPALRHEKLKEFGDLCQQCLEPYLFHPTRNTKYAMVYSVLCALANRMETESDFVKRNCFYGGENSVTSTEIRIRFVQQRIWPSNVLLSWAIPPRNSITRIPKNKYNSKIVRSSSDLSMGMLDVKPLSTLDRSAIALYREVFYVRTYELLAEAVEQACAVIDSLNNLNELGP